MSAPANSLKEKVQNLSLLCVEAICKFTPTSKLIRIYSAEVPLPGAIWQFAVEAALMKRLPLSLDDGLCHQADQANDSAILLFDNAGAQVAVVKQPEALRFSPLCEFVQSAALTIRTATSRTYPNEVRLFALKCEALLSPLPNVKDLLIVISTGAAESRFASGNQPTRGVQNLLPKLESLVIKIRDRDYLLKQLYPVDKLVAGLRSALLPLREMSSLRRLALPEDAFRYAADDQCFLAGLTSLGILAGGGSLSLSVSSRAGMLRFLSICCPQVSFLAVVVRGDFKSYAAALRAFANLCTLVLHFESTEMDLTGLTFGESEKILSLSDLRIICVPSINGRVFSIASLFPNVEALALQALPGCIPPLELASTFCARNAFPALVKLSCFSADSSGVRLMRFFAAPHLPETVDLSQILSENFARDADVLTVVYRALQANSVKKLLLRGSVHREALSRLQSSLDFTRESVEACAWKDRDLGEQPGSLNFPQISKHTDFKIVGTKTSGELKGQQFTIRIFHQLAKRVSFEESIYVTNSNAADLRRVLSAVGTDPLRLFVMANEIDDFFQRRFSELQKTLDEMQLVEQEAAQSHAAADSRREQTASDCCAPFVSSPENSRTKQSMSTPAKSPTKKTPNLPLLCVEAICKFTPTSKLIRAYSAEVPLPGAIWQFALEAALKKRNPLLLDDGLPCHQADQTNDAAAILFDKTGAMVALIRQPEAFHSSPLREFVQSAALTVHVRISRDRAHPNEVRLFALKFLALLSALPNVKQLLIVLRECAGESRCESGSHAAPNLQHLLPQLESLVIRIAVSDSLWMRREAVHLLVAELRRALLPLQELSALRRLSLPEDAFRYVADNERVLAGLVSLGVSTGKGYFSVRLQMLRHLSMRCGQVSLLSVVVRGDLKTYLAAFREFASLSTLVLDFESMAVDLTGLTFGVSERILSVSDLRFIRLPCPGDRMISIGSLFPNVTALAFHSMYDYQASLDMALKFCARNVFPALEKIRCFSIESCRYTRNCFAQFFADNSHLPEVVDLTQVLFENFARDADLFRAVYRALQANSVKKLLLRGPLHSEALPRLQSSLDLTGENAKVFAWKDRDLGEQPEYPDFLQISKHTDFRIVGTKTSGDLKGQQFTIRIFHQLAKRVSIFD